VKGFTFRAGRACSAFSRHTDDAPSHSDAGKCSRRITVGRYNPIGIRHEIEALSFSFEIISQIPVSNRIYHLLFRCFLATSSVSELLMTDSGGVSTQTMALIVRNSAFDIVRVSSDGDSESISEEYDLEPARGDRPARQYSIPSYKDYNPRNDPPIENQEPPDPIAELESILRRVRNLAPNDLSAWIHGQPSGLGATTYRDGYGSPIVRSRSLGGKDPYLSAPLKNQYLHKPEHSKRAYVSISILDPAITIERHHERYHIAARFNFETTILQYDTRQR
jgi:hypothetical protein